MARPYYLVAACLALLAAAAGAAQFRVGGRRGWSVPDASVEPYNAWAGRMRFQIGDQLLFVYPKETDSVLEVEQGAYDACNTSAWIKKFNDGGTVVTLDRSGPFFFVSGNETSCRAGEKLIVVVLADRGGRAPPAAPPSTPPSAAPAPSPFASPPSATPAATPSSAPSPAASAPVPAPMATPSSPPSPAAQAPTPAALAPSPSSSPATPGGAAQPPSASGSTPGGEGANSTTPASPAANDRGVAAAPAVAGFVTSLGACIAYAMLMV